jgi:uncharacterized damage-inducible protein DinB
MIPLKLISLFFIFLLCFVPFHATAQGKDSLLTQLERKWSNSKTYTLAIAKLMPEAFYNFKPVSEEMSFREQLLHIAKNMQWLSSSYLLSTEKIQIIDTASTNKASVIKVLSEAYDMAKAAHQKFPLNQLDEAVSFFAGPMTRRQIFILLHDHQTHHVGQIIVYLRLKGIKPPSYVGW